MLHGTTGSTSAFWGKARPGGSGPSMHPLLAHSLDVAAVASLLPRAAETGLPRRSLAFLVALHDIGKFSRNFQAMVPDHWPAGVLGPMPLAGVPEGPRHDAMGFHLLDRTLSPLLEPLLPTEGPRQTAWDVGLRAPLLRAIAGHHGRPPQKLLVPPGPPLLCQGCTGAATDFVAAMLAVFQPEPLRCPSENEIARWAWQLAGLVTLADWVGSRQAWFPYVPPSDVASPAAYFWDHALPRAAAALAGAGISGCRPAPFEGVRKLFPGITTPSPIQEWAATVPLTPEPTLVVVEDLTGSGKTEAALILAQRLMAAGRADGVFVALPTMATANAMFGRLASSYRGLFVAEGQPSLALAHGRAHLDPRFRATIPTDVMEPSRPVADPADEPAESHCAAWLADDRRKALLAQVGVGTLDQALMAVLPVRHAALRLHGLSRKVLVVDEVHAYDAYMRRELRTLLEFHAALGGSAVLLSATLPQAIRADLVAAFRRGLGAPKAVPCSAAYPLATCVTAAELQETPCSAREGLPRRIGVTRLSDAPAALERIKAAADAGAAVAWIRNTVDDAIAAHEALRALGVETILFHARFAMVDRLAIEAEVMRRFGRDSNGEIRRRVVVATQVIEQSLDLDFDLMVTDLAPVDLLIQRAGRLWRHRREGRVLVAPELLVVAPEPVAEPSADWIAASQPGTAAVYRDPALLWRSARTLFAQGAIATPEDMRPLVEAAYDDQAEGAVPYALAAAAASAAGKDQAATGVARQNLMRLERPYVREAGLWEPDTRTPTRLEEQPQVTLRLAQLRDGAVVPYAEDEDEGRAWALSEVRIAAHRIASCPVPAGLECAVEAAKSGWGRWERESAQLFVALLERRPEGYLVPALDRAGLPAGLHYSAETGLRRQQ
ncbi:CRISPR-associated helicase Cas3' [Falsiroseomonas selenitidurans]|uniref:CRISPR-associated helicase Cas3 n=1 Tax=Falsiroseomonas selenitidurans TaxID=2716335 RepID=A0ABX1DZA3_9PROT|nr:CRISPR-associated helicase Cas3' [Falsiroseomonas selenitidurans]NKC30219.1 CRISPR-associated helicase Cas3' [Falsiroseomonas selenitidurans]